MSHHKTITDLGAPIPELKNSPIISNFDEERELIDMQIPEERQCYFNGNAYQHGACIKSGTVILQCERGAWVETEVPDEF